MPERVNCFFRHFFYKRGAFKWVKSKIWEEPVLRTKTFTNVVLNSILLFTLFFFVWIQKRENTDFEKFRDFLY
jgi:hypothetical protein